MPANENPVILVVDDSADEAWLVESLLKGHGYQVHTARDGLEGFRLAQAVRPQLVLTDYYLPGLSGLELCSRLKQGPDTRHIPVILITGYEFSPNEVVALGAGVDDYMKKPVPPERLLARTQSILRRSHERLSVDPLSLLPGSSAVEDLVGLRLAQESPLSLLCVDIDHFKQYNDVYGHDRGDQLLRWLATLLKETVEEVCDGQRLKSLLAHIGGDDFLIVCRPEEAQSLAGHIARRFDREVARFYTPEDRAAGGLKAKDRQGRTHFFRFMSLSISIVTDLQRRFKHYGQVLAVASEIRRYLKSNVGRSGSAWLSDRRTGAPYPPRPPEVRRPPSVFSRLYAASLEFLGTIWRRKFRIHPLDNRL